MRVQTGKSFARSYWDPHVGDWQLPSYAAEQTSWKHGAYPSMQTSF